jgi:hypothetical protein
MTERVFKGGSTALPPFRLIGQRHILAATSPKWGGGPSEGLSVSSQCSIITLRATGPVPLDMEKL